MMRRIGGMMVGGQTGAAVGALAQEVVSSTDVGLPLGPEGVAALLPAGVVAFGEGLSVTADEVRIFLALRETAHHRLFAHVPWLRARLLGAVEDYARGISVDASALRDAMPQIDPANPEALRDALADAALFQPEDTPQQKAALARLETVLALVEGWVATVVDAAAGDRLPQAGALAEAIRRRRATGGPAERTFATLVGLELRPRRLREAAAIWQRLTDARGIDGPGRGVGPPGPAADRGGLRRPRGLRGRAGDAGHLRAGFRAGRRAEGRIGRGRRPGCPARQGRPSGFRAFGRWDFGGRAFGCWTFGRRPFGCWADGRRGRAAARRVDASRSSPASSCCAQGVDCVVAGRRGHSGESAGESTAIPRYIHRDSPRYPQVIHGVMHSPVLTAAG